jgi:hypothetical protein
VTRGVFGVWAGALTGHRNGYSGGTQRGRCGRYGRGNQDCQRWFAILQHNIQDRFGQCSVVGYEATINLAVNLSLKVKTVPREPRSIRHLIVAEVSGYHRD